MYETIPSFAAGETSADVQDSQSPIKQVRYKARGANHTTEIVVSDFERHNPVLQWLREDEQGFLKATEKDGELGQCATAVDEILTVLDSGTLDEFQVNIYSEALIERLVQLAHLAAPHLPRSASPEASEPQLLRLITKTVGQVPRLARRLKLQLHAKIPALGIAFLSPVLKQTAEAGKDRSQMLDINQTVGIFEPGEHFSFHSFLMTHLFNNYDPPTGELAIASQRREYICPVSDGKGPAVSLFLGDIDLTTTSEINVPQPTEGVNQDRYVAYNFVWEPSVVEIRANDQIIVTAAELAPYITTDELGNFFISIQDFPEPLCRRLQAKNLTLFTQYTRAAKREGSGLASSNTGPVTPEQNVQFYLYPNEIRSLLVSLQKLKSGRKEKYGMRKAGNQEIFVRLAQFIGNYWLTYELKDAEESAEDPQGFNQAERVLARRRASCEGANILLGQLMRYFLDEGESIAYCQGFILPDREFVNETKLPIKSKEFHLKVIYVDSTGEQHFFDATPWSSDDHAAFEKNAARYAEVKRDWTRQISRSKEENREVRATQSLRAEQAYERLKSVWSYEYAADHTYDAVSARRLQKFIDTHEFPGQFEERYLFNLVKSRLNKKKQISATNLVSFLKWVNGIDWHYTQLWPATNIPIDGKVELNLPLLTTPLYGGLSETSVYVSTYIGRNNIEIIKNPRLRHRLFNRMEKVYELAAKASEQNIRVYTIVADLLEQRVQRLEIQLQKAIEPHAAHLRVSSPAEFIAQAPFLLLFPHPLNELHDFFTRMDNGELVPDDETTIKAEFDQRIEAWQSVVDGTITEISASLFNAPLTTGQKPRDVMVSSLFLWQGLGKPSEDKVVPQKEYIDPTDFFLYFSADRFLGKKS